MNHIITSREHILTAAKEIAYREGIAEVSIRRVAAACGVAVGSIYNYFPTKSDLIIAVIEQFWRGVFHDGLCTPPHGQQFTVFFGQMYASLLDYLKTFQADFLQQMSSLSLAERKKGKKIEADYLEHVKRGIRAVLDADAAVRQDIWTEHYTKDTFVIFVFANMMMMLRNNQPDCTFFQQVLEKLLYSN